MQYRKGYCGQIAAERVVRSDVRGRCCKVDWGSFYFPVMVSANGFCLCSCQLDSALAILELA